MTTTIKPNAKTCLIKEQIIEDLISGLTLMFSAHGDGSRLRICGDALPLGNRDRFFTADGGEGGAGIATGGVCPSWLKAVQNEADRPADNTEDLADEPGGREVPVGEDTGEEVWVDETRG